MLLTWLAVEAGDPSRKRLRTSMYKQTGGQRQTDAETEAEIDTDCARPTPAVTG